ncbi:hypothetical protein [Labilibaculum manganireducens]|uniref:hypothetical protein n=1 Tax=Labilibaculum manganireducens TaxID=1940525 RepID=UPI0029F51FB3|nr:hypothetical protein [Labilibaculum manganireducens]
MNKNTPLSFAPNTFGILSTKGDKFEASETVLVNTPFSSFSPLSHLLFPVYLCAISFGLPGGAQLQTCAGTLQTYAGILQTCGGTLQTYAGTLQTYGGKPQTCTNKTEACLVTIQI